MMRKTNRVIAGALVLLLALGVTAFGLDASTLFEALSTEVLSAELTSEITLKLNQPLGFMEGMAEDGLTAPFDPQMLVEGLFETNGKMSGAYEMSEDYKKLKMAMEMELNLPIAINEDLKNTTWMRMGMWLEWDFSDLEKPVYRLITKTPVDSNYMVLDMAGMMQDADADALKKLDSILTEENIQAMSETMQEVLEEHAKVELSRGVYTATLDDAGMKAYLKEMLSGDFVTQYSQLEGDVQAEALAAVKGFVEALDEVQLFAEDALVMKAELDAGGKLSVLETSIHVDTNLYELMSAFDIDTEGVLTEENSRLDFTLASTDTYTKQGASVDISFPELNENNSIDYAEELLDPMPEPFDAPSEEPVHLDTYPENEEAYDGIFPENTLYAFDDALPVALDGTAYLPLRPIMGSFGVRSEEIIWKDGAVKVVPQEVTDRFSEFSVRAGESTVRLDGEEIAVSEPAVIIQDRMYMSEHFLSEVFGVEFYRASAGMYRNGGKNKMTTTYTLAYGGWLAYPGTEETE